MPAVFRRIAALFRGDAQCCITALLWILANALEMAYETQYAVLLSTHSNTTFSELIHMDSTAIADSLQARLDTVPLETTFHVVNILSWIGWSLMMARIAERMRFGKSTMGLPSSTCTLYHSALSVLGSTAAQLQITASLLFMGFTKALNWLNLHYNMDTWLPTASSDGQQQERYLQEEQSDSNSTYDGLGWKTLEVLRVTLRGMLFYIESVEYMFAVAVCCVLVVALPSQLPNTNKRLMAATGLIGLLSLLEFIECMRAYSNGRGVAGLLLGTMNHMLIIPIWIVWMGRSVLASNYNAIPESPQVRTGSVWARECT